MQHNRLILCVLAALSLTAAAKPGPLDAIARDYVQLSLEAGEREPEYVDAYYGPAEWAAAAKANPRTVSQLEAAAGALRARAEAVPVSRLSAIEKQRRALLIGQLRAAETRMAMHGGKRFSFDDEAERLFGVRPAFRTLASYDPVIAEIDRLVPGEGPLWKRVDDFENRFIIPVARVDTVMRAALAECRKRTVAHIALPADEKVTVELVTGKPWGGYNYYKGNSHSLVQVNTDLPSRLGSAIALGCHEGYPGHHVLNLLLERDLARRRGWVEFTVYPLYSPQSLVAEGSANYGIDLAFPGAERAAFEARTLFPLAGLDPAEAARLAALTVGLQKLSGATFPIVRDYLDGRIDRTRAMALTQKYLLLSEARAAKSLDFADHYRSYVINYGLGRDMVRDHVEAAGADQNARWAAMARVLSQPTVPADLTH